MALLGGVGFSFQVMVHGSMDNNLPSFEQVLGLNLVIW
jgi:hypothetical protein